MKSVGIRGSVVAAVASIFVLVSGATSAVRAQEAAAAANPELAAKGVWNQNTTYAKEDIVTARGSAWISLKANNKGKEPGQTSAPSSATWWQLFARGFNPTGAWLNSATYQPDDLVTYLGQTWRAKRTVAAGVALAAGANWELFAAKGAAGPNTGIPDGSSGAPGISFDGDSNTGIYQPEDGKIAIVADGIRFLHNIGTANTGVGLNALGNNSTGALNTAVGSSALGANTSGNDNTAVGMSALGANTTGARNTAMGSSALDANTTGNENTAIGNAALGANTGGLLNTAVGTRALLANTTGNNNTAIGTDVMVANTTGSFNIGIGSGAAASNTIGNNNVAIGLSALASVQNGANNVAIGRNALAYTVQDDNTAVGHQALYLATTGVLNTAVGSEALAAVTTGNFNVAVGRLALGGNGTDNVAVGTAALTNLTAGTSNVVMGNLALQGVTGGSGNIAIGNAVGSSAGNVTNSILIGSPSGSSHTIRIGDTQQAAFIAGIRGVTTVANDAIPVVISSTGQLGTLSSSRRYKFDIDTMADVSAMLGKLRPVTFRYKQEQDGGQHPFQYGLIAEEVAEVFPDLAVFNKDGTPETVKYHLLPNFLLAGYQAQQKTIESQAERIDALEARLARLESLLPQHKAAALR